jgi:hypothetical protein
MGHEIVQYIEGFGGQPLGLRPMPQTGLVGVQPERCKQPASITASDAPTVHNTLNMLERGAHPLFGNRRYCNRVGLRRSH